jgi:hypothetical protein
MYMRVGGMSVVRFESDGSEVDGSEVEAQRQGKRSQNLSIMKMNVPLPLIFFLISILYLAHCCDPAPLGDIGICEQEQANELRNRRQRRRRERRRRERRARRWQHVVESKFELSSTTTTTHSLTCIKSPMLVSLHPTTAAASFVFFFSDLLPPPK